MRKTKKLPWYRSLVVHFSILVVVIAVMPLCILSYMHYKDSIRSVKDRVYQEMLHNATQDKRFLLNWFHYRKIDIETMSENTQVVSLMEDLIYAFHEKKVSSSKFVNSTKQFSVSIDEGGELEKLEDNYDYIDDIYLIDLQGNILYTNEYKVDLGLSLLQGTLKKTKFAKAFQQTVDDKQIHFSDLEHYAPADNKIRGFFTAPIVNEDGRLIGVFATAIKVTKLYALLERNSRYMQKYLVGVDGLLRSAINHDAATILSMKITTQQFKLYKTEHSVHSMKSADMREKIFLYKDPLHQDVYGVHTDIDILGVKWALISESNAKIFYKLQQEIIIKTLWMLGMLFMIIIFIAFAVSKYLVDPILQLVNLVNAFALGKRDIKIGNTTTNEVGLLAERFAEMFAVIKKGESELAEQKFALDAHSIIAITDVGGTIIYVNKKFEDISGYTKSELLGKNHRILNSHAQPKEYWQAMYDKLCEGLVWRDEVKNIDKNGNYYWVDTTIVPFMDENKKIKSYIAIRTDITQQKLLAQKLIKERERAEESVKAKSEFLASMSHEIRTPMNGVIGMLSLLMNTELNESQHHQAYLAQSSASALLALINDILDFSKVEAGKLELDKQDFSIHKELGDFAEAISFRAQQNNVEVVLDISHIEMDMIYADANRIRQILNNIVGNAIKFTSKGYILIRAELHKESGNYARLKMSVTDTGIGIPEDKIATLFDSFSQVDASTTRKYGGTGLGLAIVKKLCELMDGEVQVSSELGKGSVFEIDIGVEISPDAKSVKPAIVLEDKKALIVDASKISTEVLQRQLESWGMYVTHVGTSEEALSLMDESFDIAFIDKDIKELSAEALALKCKNDNNFSQIKLVIMTSVSDRRDINLYIEHGYDAYFPKPATTSDIFDALHVLAENAVTLQNKEGINALQEEHEVYRWPENVRILLVDDNKVNQLVANGLLEEFDLEADVANNGAEALEALKNAGDNPYDIVLMDCQMPVMDGYEASTKIKSGEVGEENVKIPIVAMTANAMEGDKEKCFAAGMDDYIAKPINPDILEKKLKKYLLKDV